MLAQQQQLKPVIQKQKHNRIRSSFTVYMMCLNVSLGIFYMGFNQGVFNVCQLIMLYLNHVTDAGQKAILSGVMTAANPLGGMIGSFSASRFLRLTNSVRKSLIYADLFGIFATIILISDINFGCIIVGRFLQGLAAGINTGLVPIYTKEFSPIEIKGRTGTFSGLFQKLGLMSSYIVCLALPSKHFLTTKGNVYTDTDTWRMVVGIPNFVVLIIRFLMLSCVFTIDTPLHLLEEHHEEQLKEFLHKIYNDEDFDDALHQYEEQFQTIARHQHHLEEQQHKIDLEKQNIKPESVKGPQQQVNIELKDIHLDQNQQSESEKEKQAQAESDAMDDLESETKCRRYILGWTISLTVSFSGIDAILYYSNTIFENAGLTDWATLITVLIGVACFLASFFGVFVVEWTGRKPLVMASSIMMILGIICIVASAALGDVSGQIIGIAFHLIGYNSTLNPVRWACYLELMDPFGVGVASAIVFVFAFIIALTFPSLVLAIKMQGAFGIFLGLSCLCFVYLSCEMVETRGKSQKEIFKMFKHDFVQKKEPANQNAFALQLMASGHIVLKAGDKFKK